MDNRIWGFDVMDEYELGNLTESAIPRAEKYLNVKLPDSYIELIQNQNGGRLFKNVIQLEQSSIRIDYLLGIGEKHDEGILITPYMVKEWGLPNNIVLISGAGHSWFFLDYRQQTEDPNVSYIDTEADIEITLAADFKEFINKLSRDSKVNEFELVSENSYTTEQLEREVKKGDDPFFITDSFLYFSEVDCDLGWLVSQAAIVVDNPDEFIAPEVLAYTMRKISNTKQKTSDRDSLVSLAEKIKNHTSIEVRKYYKKIRNYV